MANVYYDNFVVEARFAELLETKLNARALMTIDNDLTEEEGMIKKVNVYSYSGTVEELEKGEGNTVGGAVSMSTAQYAVKRHQQKWGYYDDEVKTDKNVVERGLSGMADTMVNHLNGKLFDELKKASIIEGYNTFSYDEVVDAIEQMNLEDENGLILLMGNDLKAKIRKDDDFKASKAGEILYSGQFGYISGVPCLFSKKVPAGVAYLFTKKAVTLYTKTDNEMEFERNADTCENKVFARNYNVVALTDATQLVAILPFIAAPVITTSAIAAGSSKAFAGTCIEGATIKIYKDGVDTGDTGTVTGTSWSYTIATAVAGEVYSVVVSKDNFADKESATSITVGA